jgi:hypothetical protein
MSALPKPGHATLITVLRVTEQVRSSRLAKLDGCAAVVRPFMDHGISHVSTRIES